MNTHMELKLDNEAHNDSKYFGTFDNDNDDDDRQE